MATKVTLNDAAQTPEGYVMVERPDYDRRHRMLVQPVVRIRANRSSGSGTVLYSAPNDDSGHSTYVLTNHHVVADLIHVEERWSNLLQRKTRQDVLDIPEVQYFKYRYASRSTGAAGVQADIVAYSQEEDLAILKLRDDDKAPSVATMLPRYEEKNLRVTQPIYAVGAGLGQPPSITSGMLSQFGIDIESKEFWLSTAPTVFGNSGGALFMAETYQWIGVPARIAVMGWQQPITHLSYAIPVTRVYDFLEENKLRFIYDSNFTEAGEAAERERMRKDELDDQKAKDVSPDGAD